MLHSWREHAVAACHISDLGMNPWKLTLATGVINSASSVFQGILFPAFLVNIIWQSLKSKIPCLQKNDTKGGYISTSNVKPSSPPALLAIPSWLLSWQLTRLPSSANWHFGFCPAELCRKTIWHRSTAQVTTLTSLYSCLSTQAEGHFNQHSLPEQSS